jgi:hypothetical protein
MKHARAVRLAPGSVFAYQQLTRTLLALGSLPEARAVLRDARSRGSDSSVVHMLAFDSRVHRQGRRRHARASARRRVSRRWLRRADRSRARGIRDGDLETGRSLYAQAVTAARSARVNDIAASLIAEQALGDAVVGDTGRARGELQQAIGPKSGAGGDTIWTAALAAAFLGSPAGGEAGADLSGSATPGPGHVGVQDADAAGRRGARQQRTAQSDCRPQQRGAVRAIRRSRGCPTCAGWRTWRFASTRTAIVDFQTVIGHPGNQPTSIVHSLSRLQLARAARPAATSRRRARPTPISPRRGARPIPSIRCARRPQPRPPRSHRPAPPSTAR